ncbi:hypothetical protein ABH982_003393 [Bradyrhizobium ottawaense]
MANRAICSFPELLDTFVRAALQPILELCDVLLDLVDHRQMHGKRLQPGVWSGMDLLDRGGAGRNQCGIHFVVLGPLQMERGIGADLDRLKHDDDKPLASQFGDRRLLVTTACLDPNPLDLVALQPLHQLLVAFRRVLDLQLLRTAIERHVELIFAGIDSSTDRVTFGHLPRPSLVMRT